MSWMPAYVASLTINKKTVSWCGENATTHFTTAACRCGSSRTTGARSARKNGSFRKSANRTRGSVTVWPVAGVEIMYILCICIECLCIILIAVGLDMSGCKLCVRLQLTMAKKSRSND